MAGFYNAFPGVANENTVRLVGNALEVKAAYFDTIAEVCDVMWSGGVPSKCKATLSNWLAMCTRGAELDATRQESVLDFWRIICGDVVCEGSGERRAAQQDELTYVMWALTSNKSPFCTAAGDKIQDLTWSPAAKVWRDLLKLWPGRTIYLEILRERQGNDNLIPEKLQDDQGREIWENMVDGLLCLLNDEFTLEWIDWQEEDVRTLL